MIKLQLPAKWPNYGELKEFSSIKQGIFGTKSEHSSHPHAHIDGRKLELSTKLHSDTDFSMLLHTELAFFILLSVLIIYYQTNCLLCMIQRYFLISYVLLFVCRLLEMTVMLLWFNSLLLFSSDSLLLQCWFQTLGNTSCIGICITTSSCTDISIPNITGLWFHIHLELYTTTRWRGFSLTQQVELYLSSSPACLLGCPSFSSPSLPSKQLMTIVGCGFLGTYFTFSSETTVPIMTSTISSTALNTTTHSRSSSCGIECLALTCLIHLKRELVVALKQNPLKIARTSGELRVYCSCYQTYTTNISLSMWLIAYMIGRGILTQQLGCSITTWRKHGFF